VSDMLKNQELFHVWMDANPMLTRIIHAPRRTFDRV
jgi:hypothetical protein